MNNPFTLSFGKKPVQYISRIAQTERIIGDFTAEESPNQIYMITGVRGSGKTVMMTNIASEIRKRSDEWIVVELNPNRDLLQSLAAKIYAIPEMHAVFVKAKLDFSVFGLGVTVENAVPVTDIKIFASSFQIFLREEYPIYLLMTGLYENIYDLQNEKSLTFLYRAPKIILEPLNYTAIKSHYMRIFDINDEMADKMTLLTRGYPFAFQVLGYLYWDNRKDHTLEDIMPEYDQYLDEYVYSKIWAELSSKDKEILSVISESGYQSVKDIREKLDMKPELFSVYRDRLKRKGVIDTRQYGKIAMALPRFEEYVKNRLY